MTTEGTSPEQKTNKNDINISEITIWKPGNKDSLRVFPEEEGNTRFLFKNIQINEGMFSPAIDGTLVMDGSHPMIEEFNPTGGERLHIEVNTPGSDDSSHVLNFFIHDVLNTTDEAAEDSTPADMLGSENKNIIISFTSYEYYFLNSTTNCFGEISDDTSDDTSEDYIGNICR